MTSEIRANIIKNRVGLGTIEYSNTGPVISGVTTASNFKTGTSNLHSTGLNIQDLDVDGHTNLDNVSIAGVSTFSSNVTISKNNAVIELSDPDSSDANYQIRNDNGTFDIKDSTNSTVKIRATGSYVTVYPNLNANNGLDVMGTITGDGNLDIADSIRHSGDVNTKITFPANDTISIDTAGSERLRISSSGRVAIGTDNTTSATGLTVYRDDTGLGNIVNIEQDGTGDAVLGFAIKGTAAWQFGIDNSDSDKFKISYDGSGLDSSTSVTLDRTGKVGIGTDNPTTLLTLAKDANPTLTFLDYTNNAKSQILGSAGGQLVFQTDINSVNANSDFIFRADSVLNEIVRFKDSGEVGIGTDNPLTLVDIYATPIDTATLDTTNSTNLGLWVRAKNPSNTTGNIYTGITLGEGRAGLYAYDDGGGAAHGMGFFTGSNSGVAERLRIKSDGKVGINHATPDSQLVVETDGLADNTYAFKTAYRSGSNASGYTASGITIVSSANDSNGDQNTAYLQFSNRSPALNGSHGASAFITMSTPDSPGTYGSGEFNFYCRHASAYSFPNDPAVGSSYWMSSLLKIKSTGELFGYGNLRIDTGTSADGIVGRAYGTAYFGLKHADQSSDEYMMISNNNHTYISCTTGNHIYIRPSANSSAHETIFAHDNTTFSSNVVMNNHALRRNQHQWGHMEGGHNNIGSTNVKTSPIYTIGSAYNPNENDLNNMYGIGYCHSDASFINSNVTGGWGQYVASDGDARIFLNAGDGVVYANRYGRVAHNSGHLQGSYNNVGANSAQSNPIYTIGSSYNPAATTLSNMYGIGYSHGSNASFISFSGLTGWGLYVASDGDCRIFLDAGSGKIAATSTITQNASDVRLKTNIKVIDNPIEKIKKIRGVTFDWVDNITSEYDFHPDSMHETGVIAQEIQEVIPDAVTTAPFNGNYTRKSGTDNNYLTVKNEKIIPLCIEAIKKLTAKVESLEQENTALKARVTSLEE